MPFKATETKWYTEASPHRGIDIAPFSGSAGRPVRAPIHSRVHYVGFHEFAGHEVVLEVAAPYPFGATALDGTVFTIQKAERFYLRLTHHQTVLARQGERVQAGEVIAFIGSTGKFTTGPHVHLELRRGEYDRGFVLDPLDFFIAAIPGLRDHIVRPW
jgi:murein DD-endopeptidase MepM/ murein hydrolase activator NlpD